MSLVEHAEREMRLAGLYDADADYGGLIPEAVMALVRAHAEQGHSGFSHGLTLAVFNKVVNYKPLTPIGSTPDEWIEVGEGVWQNRRASSFFSKNGGKTWYDLDNMPWRMRWSQWMRREWYWRVKRHFIKRVPLSTPTTQGE